MSNTTTFAPKKQSEELSLVSISNNRVVTTSNLVAAEFNKQHTKVTRSIQNLILETGEWGVANFGDTVISNEQNGEKYQAYELTRNGFTLLAMGFTGKRALQFKLNYIAAFDMMEAELLRISAESRAQYSVNPNDILTAAQAEEIRLMLKTNCEKLPKEKQAAFMTKGWSKLKAHFGVTYRQIPQREFTEAVSLVSRHVTEWELLEMEPNINKEESSNDRRWTFSSVDGKPRICPMLPSEVIVDVEVDRDIAYLIESAIDYRKLPFVLNLVANAMRRKMIEDFAAMQAHS